MASYYVLIWMCALRGTCLKEGDLFPPVLGGVVIGVARDHKPVYGGLVAVLEKYLDV
jgi:hypothetical protein